MTARPKRRRLPAVSIRTLLIVMTLLCSYAACWWPTKTQGELDVMQAPGGYVIEDYGAFPADLYCATVAPLIVSVDEMQLGSSEFSRQYYFWFFGYVAKLPYEQRISADSLADAIPPEDDSDDTGLIFDIPEENEASRIQKAEFIERLRRGEFWRPNELPESDTP